MLRLLLSRLLATALVLSIGAGGGGLPMVDALIFHSSGQGPELFRPHYEATSGCHADGCAIRSSAQQSRFVLGLAPAVVSSIPPAVSRAPSIPSDPPFARFVTHTLSRAPPPPA